MTFIQEITEIPEINSYYLNGLACLKFCRSFVVTENKHLIAGPSRVLPSKRPMSSLVSAKNLFPLLLQIVACAGFQLAALYYLYTQKWFKPIGSDVHEEVIISWENTVLFTVSSFQYVILAWHLSKGKPYR